MLILMTTCSSSFAIIISRSRSIWAKLKTKSPSSLVFASYSTNIRGRGRTILLIPSAKKKHKKDKPWWQNFFSDDEDIWSSWGEIYDDDDAPDAQEEEQDFEAWKRRAEAITDLRDAQQDASADANQWEDWLPHDETSSSSWDQGEDDQVVEVEEEDRVQMMTEKKGLFKSYIRGFSDDDDEDQEMLFEDRVFRYASTSSAKFLAVLILVPWAVDFLVHDYVFMPFLDRYVKLVPLAAEVLDVRRTQKLEIVKTLKVEKARFQFEVEIGKSPPLSDEEVWLELRHKAIELRDEYRLENRRAFANIWSDLVYGVSLFILVYSNQGKVALLKFTGYKLLNNISDSGKAFLIILITDIFLGYHSESGWQALVETILEHYGLELDPAAITIFVCLVPVIIDACVKLWLFKFLPKLSPNVTNIFRELTRH